MALPGLRRRAPRKESRSYRLHPAVRPLRVGEAARAVNPSKTGVGPAAPPPDLPEVRRMTMKRYDGLTLADIFHNLDEQEGVSIGEAVVAIAIELAALNQLLRTVAENRGEVEE